MTMGIVSIIQSTNAICGMSGNASDKNPKNATFVGVPIMVPTPPTLAE